MRAAILLVALVVTGCADQRPAAFAARRAECKELYPAQIDQVVDRVQCVNSARSQIYPNDPITPLANAVGGELAEKVKAGQMSYAAAGAEYSREMFDANQQIARTRAANAAATAAILSTIPQYHSTSCYGGAGFATCSEY
jgi:erythromycin esterase-like protein